MTVSTTNLTSNFTGDGVTTDFPFTFDLQKAADMVVKVNGAIMPSGYSVIPGNLAYPCAGGTVRITTPPTTGAVGLLYRNSDFLQSFAVPVDGDYDEQQLNNAFDKTVMLAQQINAFTLRLPPESANQVIALLAGGYLQIDPTGKFVQSVAGPIATLTLASGVSGLVSLVNSMGTATIDIAAIAAGSILANATNASAKPTAVALAADALLGGSHTGGGLESKTVTGSGGITVTPTAGNLNVTPDAALLQHATINLSSANILAMYGAPVLLIAAPAAGKNIVVHRSMVKMVTTSTQYANGGAVGLQLGNTVHGAGTLVAATIAAGVVNAAAGTSYTIPAPAGYTGLAATGLYISNDTGPLDNPTPTAVPTIVPTGVPGARPAT